MKARGSAIWLALGLALFPALLVAQPSGRRPSLPRGADPNDWEAYYALGLERLESRMATQADAAFAWAARLAPDRGEPLFARWVAFWSADYDRFLSYLDDDEAVWRDPAVPRADSLRYRAFLLNPYVHQGAFPLIYNEFNGRFRQGPALTGWLALAAADLPTASAAFARAIREGPRDNAWLRQVRASIFVLQRQYDSAAAETQAVLATLREEDRDRTDYRSKELLEYGLGLLAIARNRPGEAEAALGRALGENLAFWPARRSIAMLWVDRDPARAVTELEQAAELAPDEVVIHHELGAARGRAGDREGAVAAYRRAIELDPEYADPYYGLSLMLEGLGDRSGAIAALEGFLARASRRSAFRARAEARLATLRKES